jgi:hypothetical protein
MWQELQSSETAEFTKKKKADNKMAKRKRQTIKWPNENDRQ